MFAKSSTCAAVLAAAALFVSCTSSLGGAEPAFVNRDVAVEDDVDAGTGTTADGANDCPDRISGPLAAWNEVGFTGAVVYVDGDIDCRLAYGSANGDGDPITTDSVFSIGSVTKTLTAVGAGVLAEDGVLNFADTAGMWVDDLASPIADLTIADLLAHTSGLADTHANDLDPLTKTDAVAAINTMPLLFDPGSGYGYSNSGYTLLAAIIEEASGQPFRDFVVDRVLTTADAGPLGGFWNGDPKPIGPRVIGQWVSGEAAQAGDFEGPHWALEGAGGVAMTPNDLATWALALLNGHVLAPDGVERVLSDREGPTYVAVGGGDDTAHNVVLAIDPAAEAVLVIASSTEDVIAENLFAEIGPALAAGEDLPAPVGAGVVDAADAASVAGTYVFDDGSKLVLETAGGQIIASPDRDAAYTAVYPVPEDFSIDAVTHEAFVRSFANGETAEGREELALLRDDFGLDPDTAIGIEILGTGYITPDLRTYIVATIEGEAELIAWLAFDDLGSLAGIDFEQPIPSKPFVATGTATFVPAASTADNATVSLQAIEGGLRVVTNAGTYTARSQS